MKPDRLTFDFLCLVTWPYMTFVLSADGGMNARKRMGCQTVRGKEWVCVCVCVCVCVSVSVSVWKGHEVREYRQLFASIH